MDFKKINEVLETILEDDGKQCKPLGSLNSTQYSVDGTSYFYDDLYTEQQIKDIFKKSAEMIDILKHINNKNIGDSSSLAYVPISSVKYGNVHTQYWGVDEVGNTVSTVEDKQAVYGIGLHQYYSKKDCVSLNLYIDYSDKPKWEVSKSLSEVIGYGTINNLVSYDQFIQIYNEFKKEYKQYYDVKFDALSDIENVNIYT